MGDTVGEAHAILDEVAASLDEATKAAHGRAVLPKASELVAMAEKNIDGDLGIGGVVFRPAGCEGAAIPGQRGGVDGEEDKEVVLEQCGDDGSLREFDTNSDGCAVEALAQTAGPGLYCGRAVLDDRQLARRRAWKAKADVVFLIGPVDANEGGEGGGIFLHAISCARVGIGTCRAAPSESNMESR